MKVLLHLWVLALYACSTVPSPQDRLLATDQLAAKKSWQRTILHAENFDLTSYHPGSLNTTDELTIFIEGDGFAWITPTRPSDDPTPQNPVALKLALEHQAGNAIYLARPCQFTVARRSGCTEDYWTNKRFAAEVVTDINQAIDQLKAKFSAHRLTLVGYSGGGTIAALASTRRQDVVRLITVAGNLNHKAWTQFHHLQSLDGSLDPADEIEALSQIPQWHIVGCRDKIIPPALIEQYIQRTSSVQITRNTFDHHCCWESEWQSLWKTVISTRRDFPSNIAESHCHQ